MGLDVRKETVFIVKDAHLEWYIQEQFGFEEYCVCDVEEWGDEQNWGIIDVDDTLTTDDNDWLHRMMDNFEDEMCNGATGVLLTSLCSKGLIEPGKYLVEITW